MRPRAHSGAVSSIFELEAEAGPATGTPKAITLHFACKKAKIENVQTSLSQRRSGNLPAGGTATRMDLFTSIDRMTKVEYLESVLLKKLASTLAYLLLR